jgi:cysteine-rich secretory family protein/S-layer family protein
VVIYSLHPGEPVPVSRTSPVARPRGRALASLLIAATLLAVGAAPVAAVDGPTFAAAANVRRAEAGVGPVAVHSKVNQIAVERGNELAADQAIGHDFPALIARFAQLGICWEALGEIVAYNSTGDVNKFITQWMNSTVHRNILLDGNMTHVGGSSKTGTDGRHYGVMIFARLCGAAPAPVQSPGPGGFYDTHSSAFGADIAWLVNAGITTGCAAGYFCPTAPVAREQMASFLKRATGLPASSIDYFVDDAASGHQPDINSIAMAGITAGCATAMYCPRSNVSREQMATFLVRALGLPPTGSDFFGDDEGSVHEDAINRLAAAGVTNGCGGGSYCPSGTVSREQMAAFLHRAFD